MSKLSDEQLKALSDKTWEKMQLNVAEDDLYFRPYIEQNDLDSHFNNMLRVRCQVERFVDKAQEEDLDFSTEQRMKVFPLWFKSTLDELCNGNEKFESILKRLDDI